MIWSNYYSSGSRIVQKREGYFILRSDLLTNNDLINIIEFIPIVVFLKIPVKRLELWTTRNSDVQCFSCVERLGIEKIKVILINNVRKQLIRESLQIPHDFQG